MSKIQPHDVIQQLEFNGMKIDVKRTARRRRMVLSVKHNGRIVVGTNTTMSLREIHRFLVDQHEWLKKQTEKLQTRKTKFPDKSFTEGETFCFLGKSYQLKVFWKTSKSMVALQEQNLMMLFEDIEPFDLQQRRELILKALKKFYRNEAAKFLAFRFVELSETTGFEAKSLALRNYKTMWGSCSRHKEIYLSWRLIVFSQEVIDYVIIHELCHLVHMNHSKKYWDLVSKFESSYRERRKQIKIMQHEADFLLLKSGAILSNFLISTTAS